MAAVLLRHAGAAVSPAQAERHAPRPTAGGPQISLVDLLDRLLGAGVVLSGDVVISLAGVDLVQVRLHALMTTIRAEVPPPGGWRADD